MTALEELIMSCTTAAAGLIESLGAPPQAHAVWISNGIHPETKEYDPVLRVAIHPAWKGKIAVPNAFGGLRVVEQDWPE